MKEKFHPNYAEALYHCASCGKDWVCGTTKIGGAKREFQGKSYPYISLEICSNCHPFYTGRSNLIDTTGRVEKFNKRFGKQIAAAAAPAAPAKKA